MRPRGRRYLRQDKRSLLAAWTWIRFTRLHSFHQLVCFVGRSSGVGGAPVLESRFSISQCCGGKTQLNGRLLEPPLALQPSRSDFIRALPKEQGDD